MLRQNAFPAILISMILIISFGILSLGHAIMNKPLVFLNYMNAYGLDYKDFFSASENIVRGQSPYDLPNHRYVTTPIPAIMNIILVPLGFDNARIMLYALIPLSLAFGYWLITSTYNFPETIKNQILITGLVCLLFGYPFYFLEERENIDGWVFLFLCLGLFLSQKPKTEIWSGLFLALAIAFKLYPVLIVLPIFLYRKWRLLFWIGLWLALLGIPTMLWFSDLLNILALRSQALFFLNENGSLFATINLIFLFMNMLGMPITATILSIQFSAIIAALIYGALLSLIVFADYRLSKKNKYEITSAILYLPFMVALPRQVYHYSLIICLILIPALIYLWIINSHQLQKAMLVLIALGIALSQWQAIATDNLAKNVLVNGIPGLGC